MPQLKIATFNVNGIRSRLPPLLEWLEKEQPDVACLQELKAPDDGFPDRCDPRGRLWRDLARAALVERRRDPRQGRAIRSKAARGLPGDPRRHAQPLHRGGGARRHRRLPVPAQRQSAARTEVRLQARVVRAPHPARARDCSTAGIRWCSPATTTSCPTDASTSTTRSRWRKDALLQPESRECYERLLAQGWTDALRALHPDERIYTFWDYFRKHWAAQRGPAHRPPAAQRELAPRLEAAGVDAWVRGLPGASDHAPTWIVLRPTAASKNPRRASACKTSATARDKTIGRMILV